MTEKKFDVGIIGAGVAGAFACSRIAENYPSTKTVLFDIGRPPGKRRRQLEGFLGSFPGSDGKLYVNDKDRVGEIVDGRRLRAAHAWVTEMLEAAGPKKITKDPLPSATAQKRVKDNNFEIISNPYIQWKPESVHELSKIMADTLEIQKNFEFSFDNEVTKIIKKKGGFLVATAANGDYFCKKIILCVGRSGWRWATALYKDLGITVEDDIAKIGIRLEMNAANLKDFNKSHCSLVRSDLELGPFSWNGTIIPEDHSDLVISAFRSNEPRWKTDKVTFSLIYNKEFKGAGVYQAERLGKLSFLLFNDRVSRERVKAILKKDTQLNLIPEFDWLEKALTETEKVIPSIINKGYFHVPHIIPIASKINLNPNLESEVEGLYVAGESSGISGILAAALTGTICADAVCK